MGGWWCQMTRELVSILREMEALRSWYLSHTDPSAEWGLVWVRAREEAETLMEKPGACLASSGVAGDGENIRLSYEVDTELTGFADGLAVGRRESNLSKQCQNWTQLSSVCWLLWNAAAGFRRALSLQIKVRLSVEINGGPASRKSRAYFSWVCWCQWASHLHYGFERLKDTQEKEHAWWGQGKHCGCLGWRLVDGEAIWTLTTSRIFC